MIRTIFFLLLIGVAALCAAWVADIGGDVTLAWNGWRISTSFLALLLGFIVSLAAAMILWTLVRGLLHAPARMRRARRERNRQRGRNAITQGLVAIGAGDADAARRFAIQARRHADDEPLALLLAAQSAQLSGDRDSARRAFEEMAARADMRILGLRGLFIEAQRNDDAASAIAVAEEALLFAPATAWASHAVLGFRCAQGDWSGAIAIVERNFSSGAIDRTAYRRQRAVLLTARAQELETSDRDLSRTSVLEAIKLAPTLIPAAALAGKFLSETQQTRKAMQVIEAAWRAQPHPDLADAYAHVRLGDSALERLRRMEKLADKTPDDAEGALGIARVAADAREFARARAALAPLLEQPTQRVALLMAEIERGEHDDDGAARAWTMRAVHARRDAAWTADGYVSDRWRPVSPTTGRIDAFRWIVPVAELPSSKAASLDAELAADIRKAEHNRKVMIARTSEPAQPAAADAAPEPTLPVEPPAAPPVFRPRPATTAPAMAIPAIVPMMRAPDDPGTDDDALDDEARSGQPGGLRGFVSRITG
jgi:HemY protein